MRTSINISAATNTVRTTYLCGVTGEIYIITVPLHKWMDWKQGEPIQKAFTQLQPHEREMLQTGITPAEWKELFPPENPDEEE